MQSVCRTHKKCPFHTEIFSESLKYKWPRIWPWIGKPAYNTHQLSVLWFWNDMAITNCSSHIANEKKYIVECPIVCMSTVSIKVFLGLPNFSSNYDPLFKCTISPWWEIEPVLHTMLCWNEVYPLTVRSLFDQTLRIQILEILRVSEVWSILYKSLNK